ncbi:RNA methyltransferase [Picrophilus oshimae]|uniref:RNA methyltransferase, TrmH family, group 1 n=1 Tax=Picrophilus torridus (strain ATCC 700027 / DSM 9790 / JCM 10055 / NBRC 100828 / KAW 2/3) TaxID=1122961 RepID=Q6L288_PICTO|nr:RNA methyltransferase [Picrophilus oshimae]AAT42914.1 rRNA methylase [Picrophilus oshimae DSM 9789]SMD30770.1 RNA methyltransferase, TrmH family, group 1 [Picrophilus oshimae DSM 9789]
MEVNKLISVVLVEPKYQGNIGAVARSMANSGLTDLRIVKTPIDEDARRRAMHGLYILDNARIYNSFDDAVSGFDIIAGTSDVSKSGNKFSRVPVSPEYFWDNYGLNGKRVALVFGREDNGLNNYELSKCNFFIKIIGNPEYPVYNLSHAVAIILYEMIKRVYSGNIIESNNYISPEHFNIMINRFEELLNLLGYEKPKVDKLSVMARRIAARSNITDAEYFKIMGIFRRIINRIR